MEQIPTVLGLCGISAHEHWYCLASEDSQAQEKQLRPLATTDLMANRECFMVRLGHASVHSQLQLPGHGPYLSEPQCPYLQGLYEDSSNRYMGNVIVLIVTIFRW